MDSLLVKIFATALTFSQVTVGPDQTLEARALVTSGSAQLPSSTDLRFTLTDLTSGDTARANDHFMAP